MCDINNKIINFPNDLDLIKNKKSNFFNKKLQDNSRLINDNFLILKSKEIYEIDNISPADLISEVRSKNGTKLEKNQIERLISEGIIKISNFDFLHKKIGNYVITYQYYNIQKSTILIIKANEQNISKVNLKKKLKTSLDLTKYYQYVRFSKNISEV